jgi:hypothetical protein
MARRWDNIQIAAGNSSAVVERLLWRRDCRAEGKSLRSAKLRAVGRRLPLVETDVGPAR